MGNPSDARPVAEGESARPRIHVTVYARASTPIALSGALLTFSGHLIGSLQRQVTVRPAPPPVHELQYPRQVVISSQSTGAVQCVHGRRSLHHGFHESTATLVPLGGNIGPRW